MTNPVGININIHRPLPLIPSQDKSSRRNSSASENHYTEIGDFVAQEINLARRNLQNLALRLENTQINNIYETPETCTHTLNQRRNFSHRLPMIEKVVHALSAAMPIVITASSVLGGIIGGTIEAATACENTNNPVGKTFSKILDGAAFGVLAGSTLTVLPFVATVIGHRIKLATNAQYAEQFRRTEPSHTVFAKFLQVEPEIDQSQTVLMSELLNDWDENIEFDVNQQRATTPSSPPSQVPSALNFTPQKQVDSSEVSALYAKVQKKEDSKDNIFSHTNLWLNT